MGRRKGVAQRQKGKGGEKERKLKRGFKKKTSTKKTKSGERKERGGGGLKGRSKRRVVKRKNGNERVAGNPASETGPNSPIMGEHTS